jgi:hypothetical protein
MPLEVGQEKGVPERLTVGTTFSVSIPLRGVISMRVVELVPGRLTAATTGGHPLAGTVSLGFRQLAPRRVRLEVEVLARAADALDGVVMSSVGSLLQDANWREVLERLVELTGGQVPKGIVEEQGTVEGEAAQEAQEKVAALVAQRRRRTRVRAVAEPASPARPSGSRRKPRAKTAPVSGRRGPRRPAGTGSARRTRAGTGSGRTSGRTAPRAAARRGSRTPR